MRSVVLALMIAGCGRLGFGAAATGDATGDASDAAPVARCDPGAPFETVQAVTGINDPAAYDSTFTLSADELSGYFYSDRVASNADLYMATRPDVTSAWTVAPLTSLNSASADKEPVASDDGSVLVFASLRPPSDAGGDLWFATRDATGFTLGGRIDNLNTPQIDYHPFFQLGTNELWFSSRRTGTLGIYHATHLGGGSFTDPLPLTELDVAGSNTEVAIVSPDGLTMYFRSNRPGGLGDIDIYVARRASTAAPFSGAVDVTEVNSAALDTPTWISPDLCRLYLSSSRGVNSDIYVATRTQ